MFFVRLQKYNYKLNCDIKKQWLIEKLERIDENKFLIIFKFSIIFQKSNVLFLEKKIFLIFSREDFIETRKSI